jgi:nucleoside-diphosphate-sugar epimerase
MITNRSGPDLPGAWRRVAVNRKPDAGSARYDMTPAMRDFGYRPQVLIDEGLARLAESYTRPS